MSGKSAVEGRSKKRNFRRARFSPAARNCPAILSPRILAGIPLPTPSVAAPSALVGSLRSQHGFAMNVTAAENNEKKFYKFVCNGRAKEIIKVPAKRMAERNAPDKRDRVWRSLSETVGDFPRSFYP